MPNKIIYADFATKNLAAFEAGSISSISTLLYGGSQASQLEEVNAIVRLIEEILTSVHSRFDMISCFLSHRGDLLKNELNRIGINDEILNDIAYLHASKFSGIYNPMLLPKILRNLYDVAKTLNEQGIITLNDYRNIVSLFPCEEAFADAYYGINNLQHAYLNAVKIQADQTSMKVA